MARIARIVLPGFPHHLTQRGNRRQRTSFIQDDYRTYRALLAEWCCRCGVAVWPYCLMPNDLHLIVVPKAEDGLRRAIGEAHRRYTRSGERQARLAWAPVAGTVRVVRTG